MAHEKLTAYLTDQADLQLAILFGSCATGAARPDSDLDLAVACPKPLSSARKKELIAGLATLAARPIDLVDLHTAPPTLLRSIFATAEVLLKRDTTLYAFLMRRLWNWDADMSAIHNEILRARRERDLLRQEPLP